MNQLIIERWKDSFRDAFACNGEHCKETGFFCFEITVEQKEYLEDHIELIDAMCEDYFDKVPHTIKFEPFNNGMEYVYTCDCYF